MKTLLIITVLALHAKCASGDCGIRMSPLIAQSCDCQYVRHNGVHAREISCSKIFTVPDKRLFGITGSPDVVSLRLVDFTGNNVPSEIFYRSGWASLESFYLATQSKSTIRIDPNAFKGLNLTSLELNFLKLQNEDISSWVLSNSLESLVLEDMDMTDIDAIFRIFRSSEYPKLKFISLKGHAFETIPGYVIDFRHTQGILIISGNDRLSNIDDGAFCYVHAVKLDLGFNNLAAMNFDWFCYGSFVEELNLDDNHMTALDAGMSQLPEGLKRMTVSDNRFDCNCEQEMVKDLLEFEIIGGRCHNCLSDIRGASCSNFRLTWTPPGTVCRSGKLRYAGNENITATSSTVDGSTATSTTTPSPTTSPNCPEGSFNFDDQLCIHISHELGTWDEYFEWCEEVGAKPVKIQSDEKHEFIKALIPDCSTNTEYGGGWIGLKDFHDRGRAVHVAPTELTWIADGTNIVAGDYGDTHGQYPWRSSEPETGNGYANTATCYKGAWYIFNSAARHRFVCESL